MGGFANRKMDKEGFEPMAIYGPSRYQIKIERSLFLLFWDAFCI